MRVYQKDLLRVIVGWFDENGGLFAGKSG